MTYRRPFKFTDEVVALYDALLVPRVYLPSAELLLSLTSVPSGGAVLDVATGPGTLARVAAGLVGTSGRIVATDFSPAMLRLARTKSLPAGAASIDFIESPASPLAVPDASFDLVACHHGLQFFASRLAALSEMHRALKPRGRIALAVWADIETCPIYLALYAALEATVPARIAEAMRVPFGHPGPEALRHELEFVGFRPTLVTTRPIPVVFESGFRQVWGCLEASPLWPQIADLPNREQTMLADAAYQLVTVLQDPVDGTIRSQMACHLAVGEA